MTGTSLADPTRCAEAIVDRVGRDIRLAIPIGIGKPILLIDALYRLAEADRSVKLSIFTGLTLIRPRYRNMLERRFVEPLLDRLFATYSEPLYVAALERDSLPANITVTEFFLQAGAWLANGAAQRSHVSLNYSHVAGHLERIGANVFTQLVAPHPAGDARVSLSSNTDVTLDMLPYIAARRRAGLPVVVAGEVNANLPYMPGEAEIGRDQFDLMLEPQGEPYALFAQPKQPALPAIGTKQPGPIKCGRSSSLRPSCKHVFGGLLILLRRCHVVHRLHQHPRRTGVELINRVVSNLLAWPLGGGPALLSSLGATARLAQWPARGAAS